MILDSKSGIRGVLVDESTGQRIAFARKANLETGEWEAWQATPDGKEIWHDADGKPVLLKGRCRLKFIPAVLITPGPAPDPEDVKIEAGYKEAFCKIWRDRGFSPWWIQWRWNIEERKRSEEYLGRVQQDARAAAEEGPHS